MPYVLPTTWAECLSAPSDDSGFGLYFQSYRYRVWTPSYYRGPKFTVFPDMGNWKRIDKMTKWQFSRHFKLCRPVAEEPKIKLYHWLKQYVEYPPEQWEMGMTWMARKRWLAETEELWVQLGFKPYPPRDTSRKPIEHLYDAMIPRLRNAVEGSVWGRLQE